MAHPTTGKRFVALSAAVALGFGGAMIAGPASAAPTAEATATATPTAAPTTDAPVDVKFEAAAAKAFTASDKIAAIGHGANGELIAQVVAENVDDKQVAEALEPVEAFAQETTGDDLVIQEVGGTYTAFAPEQGDDEGAEATAYSASDDIVAGAGYGVDTGGGQYGLCSVGFPATDASGNDVLITAGHCSDVGGEVYVERPSTTNVFTGTYDTFELDESRKLGTFVESQFGPMTLEDYNNGAELDPASAQDFAVIEVDESAGFNLLGEVATWSESSGGEDDLAADTTPITGTHDVVEGDIGKTVFHSGRTTGTTSGEIDMVDGIAPIGDPTDGTQYLVYGFSSNTPVDSGDSGGTVMMGDKAVGVVSGGAPASDGQDALLWAAELSEGLKQLDGDYEIKTSGEPTEEPTETATPTPTPTETDDADVDPSLAVDPQEIAAERFIAEDEDQAIEDDRGVTYTVTDAEPGSEVTFDTYAGGDAANAGSGAAPAADAADEPAKSITVTADEDGVASSRVWGLPTADASAYVGDYSVVATTETETLEGSFSVVEGSGDGDEGDGGEDLPRTGSTVAPLVAGAAGLVALGGALVYVARRRQA
ncbi:trypsin-like serine protease [Brevibacterium senegalense]|uniref:trypsin-like serine protease n=1 Tax=Brevibacterium senegalense TaxID=1033736 RepID=UPI000378DE96|nr:trypsin-like serine protease [Brevibacterium senegalense]